eukprot:591700-Prymnesium_polylepis.1
MTKAAARSLDESRRSCAVCARCGVRIGQGGGAALTAPMHRSTYPPIPRSTIPRSPDLRSSDPPIHDRSIPRSTIPRPRPHVLPARASVPPVTLRGPDAAGRRAAGS